MTDSRMLDLTLSLRGPAELAAALRNSIGAAQFDFRSRAGGRRCDHDIPCIAHDGGCDPGRSTLPANGNRTFRAK